MAAHFPVILLIEHDSSTRNLYYRELKSSYHVLPCSNEIEALNLLQNYSIDLIILEPVLPGGQGWAFLALLRAKKQTRTIPVILCTTLNARHLGVELGVAVHLIKPVLPDDLNKVIHQITGSSNNNS